MVYVETAEMLVWELMMNIILDMMEFMAWQDIQVNCSVGSWK